MVIASNLARAEMAVAYVDSAMRWPSTNRPDDREHRRMHRNSQYRTPYYGPAFQTATQRMRRECASVSHIRDLNHPREFGCDVRDNVEYILTKADIAIKHGVGVCDELAAVAFKWLVEIQQVPCSVSYYMMDFNTAQMQAPLPMHCFVILGETHVPPWRQLMRETLTPATWPPDAVWCDPWRRDCFEIKDDWRRRVRMIVRDCGYNMSPPLRHYGFECKALRPAPDQSTPWRHDHGVLDSS